MSEPDQFTVTTFFGDAQYDFSLHDKKKGDGWGLLRELERKQDAGCFAIFRQLYSGNYTLDTVREILRLGFIGGGRDSREAAGLVGLYVDREPLITHAGLALEVLGAVLFGKGNTPPPEAVA